MRNAELDGLRAIAVMAVIYYHAWTEELSLGPLGVRLFFVLSGFLITRILLAAKAEAENGASQPALIGTFYLRRALRIWPAYFLLMALLAMASETVRSALVWYLLFLTNVLFVVDDSWSVGSHLWTLAIEQQFYLVWPLVVLLLPRAATITVCVALIVAGILWRAIGPVVGLSEYAQWLLPPANFDALAAGSLLAIVGANRVAGNIWIGGVAALSALLALLPPSPVDFSLLPMVVIVAMADEQRLGWLGAGLRWGPVAYVGRISYGVYLYHLPIVAILLDGTDFGLPSEIGKGPGLFAAATVLSIGAAALSWGLFERPINAWRLQLERRA
jgi:peptidoglycan/LPS O-acetylase OafA/YrhL